MSRPDPIDPVDDLLLGLEPLIIRAQFNQAQRRLREVFEQAIIDEGLDAGRRLIELVHLLGGNRRLKHVKVNTDRRAE